MKKGNLTTLRKRIRRRILFWLQSGALRLANRLNWFASRCYYKAITSEDGAYDGKRD